MSDQFSEWDRFYEKYEKALTPGKAMRRYRKQRRRRENLEALTQMLRTIEMKKASASHS